MPLDPSIPLSGSSQKPLNLLDTASQAFTLKSAMAQSQQVEQQQKDQQTLREAFSDPSGVETNPETGIPTLKPERMQWLAQQNPMLAQKVGQANMAITANVAKKKQQDQEHQMKVDKFIRESAGPMAASLMADYQASLQKNGGNSQAAWKDIEQKVQAANQQIQEVAQRYGIPAKPITNEVELEKEASGFAKYAEQKLRAQQPRTPHEVAMESKPQSPLGKLEADFKDKKISKADYEAEKKKLTAPTAAQANAGNFDGDNGKLMAAMAERGIALPAGLRSQSQQLGVLNGLRQRNPDLSVDQIADKVKSGQIDLANEKTWGRVAAGIGGKVAYAENEIKQTIPLVREASAKLPRGEFVPYNRLKQMGQEAFSNPDLAEFRMYMTSLSNAYDMLAARGGTDMEKRAENRKNFDMANSPEALERVMQAVMKEAQASGRAAQQSLRTPGSHTGETPAGGGGKRLVFDPATGTVKPSGGEPDKSVPQ